MRYISPLGMPEDSPYINGDPTIARLGSIPPAEAFEHPLRELVGLINKSGLTPSSSDLLQVVKSIRSQYANFAEDTGSVNNLSVAYDPPILVYTKGLPLRVRVRSTNNGSSTIDAGAGRALIRRPDGLQLLEGDLPAGSIANLVFDGTTFQLMNFGARPAEVTINELPLPYCVDTSSTPNIIVAPFSPEIVSEDLRPGLAVLVKIANTNSNATIIKINNLVDIPVYGCGHGSLYAYDIARDDVKLFVFDGTVFWIEPSLQARKFGAVAGWVRTDGNDVTGDGTSNTPEKAFRTIQRAYEAIGARYAPSPLLTIDIRLGVPGRYDGALIGPYGGGVAITGDAANRNAYEVGPYKGSPHPGFCIGCNAAYLSLEGFNLVGDLSTPTAWAHLITGSGAWVGIRDLQFETRTPYLAGNFVSIASGATVEAAYSRSPGGTSLVFQGNGHQMGYAIAASSHGAFTGGQAAALTHTAFYNTRLDAGFVSSALSVFNCYNMSVSHAGVTGNSFYVTTNALMYGGGNWLPGDQPGYTNYNGIYIP